MEDDLDEIIESAVQGYKNCHPLITSTGSEFEFSDREPSLKMLADCLQSRYYACKTGKRDKSSHPIPLLANGPGSGKSRFLQELSKTFRDFVAHSPSYSEQFKEAIESAVYINISFGNDTAYSFEEGRLGIRKSLCIRLLHQIIPGANDNFEIFFHLYKDKHLPSFASLLEIIAGEHLIVLAIDEINQVDDLHKVQFAELFVLVSRLSCVSAPVFAPILAGTAIGSMSFAVTKSTHPPLYIPLPSLEFKSSLNIINAKFANLVEKVNGLQPLIYDLGGHPRALEFLYDGLADYWKSDPAVVSVPDLETDFAKIDPALVSVADLEAKLCHRLEKTYRISTYPFGAAIAYSFLGLEVSGDLSYPDNNTLTFLDLQEKGLLKLDDFKVKIPYVFVCSYLINSKSQSAKFWSNLLIKGELLWQQWESFGQTYLVFRMSLFAHLKHSSITLEEFFANSQMNLGVIRIKVPKYDDMKLESLKEARYPQTKIDLKCGVSYLNVTGAPFDSFMCVQKEDGSQLLLIIQSKWSYNETPNAPLLSQTVFDDELRKTKRAMDSYLPGVPFIVILMGHRKAGSIKLPVNCVLVSKADEVGFFGKGFAYKLSQLNPKPISR